MKLCMVAICPFGGKPKGYMYIHMHTYNIYNIETDKHADIHTYIHTYIHTREGQREREREREEATKPCK